VTAPETPSRWGASAWVAGVIVVVGAALTGLLAHIAGMRWTDTVKLFAIAGGPALAAGAAGLVALLLLRRSPIGIQALVAGLAAMGAVAVGAAVAARSMFISSHDLSVLGVILAASATVGILVSLMLGARVAAAVRALRAAARRIGDGDLQPTVEGPPPGELAALARELSDMTVRLDESRRRERVIEGSRRELVAWISHDLRTPLAAIRAMAEALEDGVVSDDETMARYHGAIAGEAERLAGMVDDLFELSRINAGALRLDIAPVSLGDLVSDSLSAASLTAEAKGVRLEGRVNGASPEVPASTAELSRALRNLLENAIRHTPFDGSVCIEAGVDGDRAYVSVSDECGGIPDGDLDRVFDMAFRGAAARTPGPDGGAGLGLAIARGIALAHHGEITVRNENGGCRFTLRLPLEQPA